MESWQELRLLISPGTLQRRILYFSRLTLIGLFIAITVLQLLAFPGQFRHEADTGHGSQLARWVLTFIVGIWFLFAQISIVAIERILTLIHQNELGRIRGIFWVNLLIRTLMSSAFYGVAITVFAAIKSEEPGPGVITATLTVFCTSAALISMHIRYQLFNTQTLSKSSGE